MTFVHTERDDLAEDLWQFGEDELAERVAGLSDLDLGRIGVLAARRLSEDRSESGMLIAKAVALAAVEVMEGRRRELRRRRRRAVERPEPRPRRDDAEKPRDVYLDACEAIAERLADRGFRFARSGPHTTLRAPPYAFVIGFGSSHYNVAGESVTLRVAATVESRELAAWRRRADADRDDPYVAGGSLEAITQNFDLEWDVADPGLRPDAIDAAVATIEAIGLPYFEMFKAEEALVDRLRRETIPMFDGFRAIEWLLWKGFPEEALLQGQRLLPDTGRRRRYERMLERYRRGDMHGRWLGESEELAYATVTYGLEF